MHELGATEALIELAEKECAKKNIPKPKRILAVLGALSSYCPEPILMYFDLLRSQHQILSECELAISAEPAVVKCKKCGKERKIKDMGEILCPTCDKAGIEIVSGKDLYIKEIEY